MAEFEVDGKIFDTNKFSDEQKNLLNNLSMTKVLVAELAFKTELFKARKEQLDKSFKSKFGSKLKDILEIEGSPQLKLANGKNISLSELSEQDTSDVSSISFVNEQISYYSNQLQVLDTARITISREFYEIIKTLE